MIDSKLVQNAIDNLDIDARASDSNTHVIVTSRTLNICYPVHKLYLDCQWSKRDAVFYLKREFKK